MSYQGSPLELFHTKVETDMSRLLQAAKKLLETLPPEERTQLFEWVIHDRTDTSLGIETTAGVCGGAACLAETRIPVWLLEQYRRSGASDAELLHSYPSLRAEDLVHAWAYVRSHRNEIERHIQENEAA